MGKIFKNMAPYWYVLIVIFIMLGVQAYCDLAMPQYTSDIIDVGIQNGGIEHVLPEKITTEDFKYSTMFMTDEEAKKWEDCYEKKSDIYELKITDEDKLDKLDEELLIPVILTYGTANTSEADFKTRIKESFKQNKQMAAMADKIDDMSIKEIGELMKTDFDTFEAENEDGDMVTYVNMLPMMQSMIDSKMMSKENLLKSREQMKTVIEKLGSSMMKARGVAYAKSCDKNAGMDIEKIQKNYLWTEGGKMILMACVMMIASVIVGYLASKVGAGIGRKLRTNVFERVVSFSNAEMDKFSTASLITRSTNDIQQVQMVTTMLLRMLLYAPIIGVGGVIKVYNTGANMGWIIGLAVVAIVGFIGVLMSIAMPKFKIMQKLVDRLNLVSREILTGLSVIRAFGREKKEEERFEVANQDLTRTQLFTNRVMTFMMPGMMLALNATTILIMWVSSNRIDAGTLQVGSMTAFITYSMQIVMSFLILSMMSIMLPRAGVAAERIDEVLKTETTIVEKTEPKKLSKHEGVVTFSHVNFRYPEAKEDVLEDIDFTAETGKTTAIIGSTGCGKSTLINLIPRFYDITAGSITIDGEDIRDISLSELRDEIGFVPQKGVLFSGTIASNLRFGMEDATDTDIEEAAKIAQATEFINDKKKKFESSISQGGTNVSGGQKQRLAIARAIVKNPKVYIFDDSFSALDMKTDVMLRKALEKKTANSSVIIVAQRISTIMNADQIIVLDDGRIAGKGTHDYLLKNCEVYQQIAQSQLSAKELGIETEKEGR